MSLVIILFHGKAITPEKFKAVLSPEPKTTMMISDSVWILRTSESAIQILKKIKKESEVPVSVFVSPSRAWATSLENNDFKKFIDDSSGDDFGPVSFPL